MKSTYLLTTASSLLVLLAAGCGATNSTSTVPATTPACVPSSTPEFAYVLTGYAVSMYTVNSCTGAFTATAPATIGTGYTYPQNDNSEEMVVDPAGRFAYVANLVSNASDLSTISMYTIDSTTGALTTTTPATCLLYTSRCV